MKDSTRLLTFGVMKTILIGSGPKKIMDLTSSRG